MLKKVYKKQYNRENSEVQVVCCFITMKYEVETIAFIDLLNFQSPSF